MRLKLLAGRRTTVGKLQARPGSGKEEKTSVGSCSSCKASVLLLSKLSRVVRARGKVKGLKTAREKGGLEGKVHRRWQ